MNTVAQRLLTLRSNLEAAQKTGDPNAPHHMLLLQLRTLTEIVADIATSIDREAEAAASKRALDRLESEAAEGGNAGRDFKQKGL